MKRKSAHYPLFRYKTLLCVVLFVSSFCQAQVTKKELYSDIDKMGSNYYPYPGGSYKQTPPPSGYEAFYITHFGRHGSRFLINNKAYTRVISLLEKADSMNLLTRKGKKLLKNARIAYAYSKDKEGTLSILGGKEHKQIARRAFKRHPGVFSDGAKITARSTSSGRCQKSMKHFLSELKLNNPNLVLDDNGFRKEAAWYMSNSRDSVTPVPGSNTIRDRAREVRDSLFSTVDLLPLFLKDTTNISDYYKEGNIEKFSGSLYDIAEDMMCLPELKMKRTFRKYFTKDQLYTIFLANSISWLISPGYYKGMTPIYKRGYFILKHMFDNAEEIIKNNEHGAFLRFSHDGFMMHLLRALELDGSREVPTDFLNVCDHFSLFQAIPMGSNVQIVFYRKTGGDDILVKFLLQEEEKHIPLETDIWPYYHWKDVKAFYYPKIKSYLRTRN